MNNHALDRWIAILIELVVIATDEEAPEPAFVDPNQLSFDGEGF